MAVDWTFRTLTFAGLGNRAERRKWRAATAKRFPHHVDLVPEDTEAFDDAVTDFLLPLKDRIEMYGIETDNGGAAVRYLFKDASDAAAFRQKFAIHLAGPSVGRAQ